MALEEKFDISIPELKSLIVFRKQPADLPADLRPTWRIALIVLLLKNCCQQARTSLARLHVLSWGIRTPENREFLRAAVEKRLTPDALVVRFEPFLNRAIDYALGEGLITREGGTRYLLSPSGRRFAEEVEGQESLFREEKLFMQQIKAKVTETLVKQMFG